MIDFFIYDSLDSTMNQASKLLEEGMKSPFAALAYEQTLGRGTQGRTWISEEGGLFITIATSFSDFLPMMITFVPLYAAVILHQWIFKTFQIKTHIKWPNDILFEDRKLAGILCEAKSFGSESAKNQVVLIGFGVNIYSHPDLDQSYEGISIKSIDSSFGNVLIEDLGLSFFSFWKQKLNDQYMRDMEHIKKLFFDAHLPSTRAFTDGKDLYYFHDIQNDGSLILASGEKKVCLSSSHHGYELVR